MSGACRYRRNPDVLWRDEEEASAEVAERLCNGEDAEDTGTGILFSGGAMLSLNYLAMEIWKLCDGATVDEMVEVLMKQFDVEEELLRGDVLEFLEELARKGFITGEE